LVAPSIAIVGEGEMVLGVQPAMVGATKLRKRSAFYHYESSNLAESSAMRLM
jgi:hypothetical protein